MKLPNLELPTLEMPRLPKPFTQAELQAAIFVGAADAQASPSTELVEAESFEIPRSASEARGPTGSSSPPCLSNSA